MSKHASNDEAGRAARAKALHRQIDQIKAGRPAHPPAKESPLEFVERRMKELAQKKKQGRSKK
jgi:hypothetical protein